MGTLYIVATPIGNLKDITIRAIEVLHTVPIIACEDTRKTGFLLKSTEPLYHKLVYDTQESKEFKNRPRLISFYEENEQFRIPEIINILKDGLDVALVSDAGTPLVSDPGFKLVRTCYEEGIKVISVPGASSVLAALTSSGLPTDKFLFLGFLPKKEGHRKKLLETVAKGELKKTVVVFEAPHRVVKMLGELKEVCGDIEIVLCRELTKLHEEVRKEKISESLEHFSKVSPKGEFVLLFQTPQ